MVVDKVVSPYLENSDLVELVCITDKLVVDSHPDPPKHRTDCVLGCLESVLTSEFFSTALWNDVLGFERIRHIDHGVIMRFDKNRIPFQCYMDSFILEKRMIDERAMNG